MLDLFNPLVRNNSLIEFIAKSAFVLLPLAGLLFIFSKKKSNKVVGLGVIIFFSLFVLLFLAMVWPFLLLVLGGGM